MSGAKANVEALRTRFPAGARPYRLTGTGAFEAVFRHGTRHEGRYVQLVTMPAAHPLGRAGFVVGRKTLPRAVDRNRLRRLLREMLRSARAEANAFDLVVRLKKPLTAVEIPHAVAEAARLLAEARGQGPAMQQRPGPR